MGIGAVCIVAGGLVAAVTGPLDLTRGSWLAAYLVLVGGVAQYLLGWAPGCIGTAPMQPAAAWTTPLLWNVGNAGVIAGTLLTLPLLVAIASALLLAAVALAALQSRHIARGRTSLHRATVWAYRGVLLVLLVSIPVGIVLAVIRSG